MAAECRILQQLATSSQRVGSYKKENNRTFFQASIRLIKKDCKITREIGNWRPVCMFSVTKTYAHSWLFRNISPKQSHYCLCSIFTYTLFYQLEKVYFTRQVYLLIHVFLKGFKPFMRKCYKNNTYTMF